jgi:hypothetical protein
MDTVDFPFRRLRHIVSESETACTNKKSEARQVTLTLLCRPMSELLKAVYAMIGAFPCALFLPTSRPFCYHFETVFSANDF